eukprot:Skav211846  [mRNA]  locus=scaffold305:845915:847355:+ [translate_table: standard]
MTPLLKASYRFVETWEEKYSNIIEWLVGQGADPTYRFPATWPRVKFGGQEVSIHGSSVLDIVTSWLHAAEKTEDVADDTQILSKLIQRITAASLNLTSPQRHQVRVDQSIVDLWERILGSTSSHDVNFLTADATVSAHSLVLQEASPVLKAMLSSCMKEGKTGQIEVRDASSSALRLFLEILYTCSSSSSEPSCEDTLAALDLAHRWQISGVVGILEEVLQEMISEETFWAIAEAAALKDLAKLKSACKSFIGKVSQAASLKQPARWCEELERNAIVGMRQFILQRQTGKQIQ